VTLPEQLRKASTHFPNLGTYYIREDGVADFQSYSQLLEEASTMASGLISLGMNPGDKAIIATTENRQTITVLWACFLSGVIPTILQPPETFTEHNPAAVKLMNVFLQLCNPVVFTSGKTHITDPLLVSRIILWKDIPKKPGVPDIKVSENDLAFIQYSSGSTGDPKGIMLSHRNLTLNIEAIIQGLNLQPHDHGGSWMPLYHDMGLIGYHLTPVICPCNQYHIETIDFIKNPGLWLDMLSNQKITVSGCPNFGQALVLRFLKRRPRENKWDFSPLKALLNGAEPISGKIMEEFTHAMKDHGFHPQAMMPVYGMAEATLAISFSPLMTLPVITSFESNTLDSSGKAVKSVSTHQGRHSRTLISVGRPIKHVTIRIVDEGGNELPENHGGHIQVKGGSITSGYYSQPEATAAVFNDEWLLTGDMGFIFEGNLYISGRYKDIIFMNGRNHYAHDLENLACTLDEISYGKIIIGGITDPRTGKEKVLAFLASVPESQASEMFHRLKSLFRKNLGISLDELILIRSNEIPKTSSGKIQRYRLIQRYLNGEFRN